MIHVRAGLIIGGSFFLFALAAAGLIHFVGLGMAGIIFLTAVVIGTAAAVIDYLTDEER